MSVHIHAPPPTNTFVQVRRLRCRKWETVSESKSFEAAVVYASRQLRFSDVKEVRVLTPSSGTTRMWHGKPLCIPIPAER